MVWSTFAHLFTWVWTLMEMRRLSDQEKDLEILLLRHPLNLLVRKQKKPFQATRAEKFPLAVWAAIFKAQTGRTTRTMADVIRLFQPETVFKWHRELIRRKWTYTRKNNGGRPAERWVRTVREECLDHLLIFTQAHLRRVLNEFVDYYNSRRPHQGLNQRSPLPRSDPPTVGRVQCRKVLGGLINDYSCAPSNAIVGLR